MTVYKQDVPAVYCLNDMLALDTNKLFMSVHALSDSLKKLRFFYVTFECDSVAPSNVATAIKQVYVLPWRFLGDYSPSIHLLFFPLPYRIDSEPSTIKLKLAKRTATEYHSPSNTKNAPDKVAAIPSPTARIPTMS
jgi:hypothetical protein